MDTYCFKCNDHFNNINDLSDDEKSEKCQNLIKKLYEFKSIFTEEHLFKSDLFVLSSGSKKPSVDSSRYVYKIEKNSDGFLALRTGLYVGTLYYEKNEINIECDYEDDFLLHILDTETNVFVERNVSINNVKKSKKKRSLTSYITEYLFLSSLKRTKFIGLPQQYNVKKDQSFNVKGLINFTEYINKKHSLGGKIPQKIKTREFNQDIVDVICAALDSVSNIEFFEDLKSYISEIKKMSKYKKGTKISYLTVARAKKAKILENYIYSPFKKVLDYAEMVILKNNLIRDKNDNQKELTGYLVNVADLWEDYLTNLLINHFPDWEVYAQEKIILYDDTFFARSNKPDILMFKMNGSEIEKIVILDAKFKKMTFNPSGCDVDREDLFQIHSYTGYYNLKHPNKVVLSGLIYPTVKENDSGKSTSSKLYGLTDETDINFGVFTLFASTKNGVVTFEENEVRFINSIKQHIDD